MTRAFNRRYAFAIAALGLLWLAMLLLGGPDSAMDAALLRAAREPGLVPAARLASILGGGWVLLPASLLIAAWLAVRGARRNAALLALLVLGGRLLVELQKTGFDRVRPDPAGHLVAIHNMAFPSGHAANSMMALLGVALIAFPAGRRRAAIVTALLLTALVGLSRLVLAVHWPSDVIGGWAFGAALAIAVAAFAAEREAGSFIDPPKERTMSDRNGRPDDSALIDAMEEAPSHGGSSGGNVQRDVATQAEEEHEVGGATGVTRVTGEDKPADDDEPNLPARD